MCLLFAVGKVLIFSADTPKPPGFRPSVVVTNFLLIVILDQCLVQTDPTDVLGVIGVILLDVGYRVDRNLGGNWIFSRSISSEKTKNQKSTKSIRRNSWLLAN